MDFELSAGILAAGPVQQAYSLILAVAHDASSVSALPHATTATRTAVPVMTPGGTGLEPVTPSYASWLREPPPLPRFHVSSGTWKTLPGEGLTLSR